MHWPHSKGVLTVDKFKTPFTDGVVCCALSHDNGLDLTKLPNEVGVQAQVFTIINDDSYYWPDLMRGMIVD